MRAFIKATIATPMSLSGYDPAEVDTRFYVRPTSLKGVWRWWARAIAGGVLYERGCLTARRGRDTYMELDRRAAERVSRAVGIALGLGYAGEEGEAAQSRFKLAVRPSRPPSVPRDTRGQAHVGGRPVELQRFKLLGLSRRPIKYVLGGEIDIEVEARGVDRRVFEAALDVLYVALTLQGLGKGSRKGLGSLDVEVRGDYTAKPLKEALDSAVEKAGELIGDRCGPPPDDLPPIPVVSRHTVGGRPVSEVYTIRDLHFEDLHNFFSRPHRARVLAGHYSALDPFRRSLNAWVLGLPREQRGTGYRMPRTVKRRASTIMVTYHQRHVPAGGQAGFLTVLRSGDWPAQLEWVGGGRRTIAVDRARILAAYDDALAAFDQYVKALNGGMTRIWP